MRKLVTLREVLQVNPIEGADLVEVVVVDGWEIVVQKGLYNQGDLVVYFEYDSFLPSSDLRYESFMKFGVQKFNGVEGHRLKTKRIRKVYSQGIVLSIDKFPEITEPLFDTDYSELLGIVQYKRDESKLVGNAKGYFPSFLKKSDQPRIQNIYHKSKEDYLDELFVGTLKMDGSSITVYCRKNEQGEYIKGICSRNLELKLGENPSCIFHQGVYASDLLEKVQQLCTEFNAEYAIQGELVGPGIQGNYEQFDTYQVFAYNIFDIKKQKFVNYGDFASMAKSVNLQVVPVIYTEQAVFSKDLKTILKEASGKGLNCKHREGIVWKSFNADLQFKVISNEFLDRYDTDSDSE